MRRLLVLALALLCAAWSPGTFAPAQYGSYGAPLPGYQANGGATAISPPASGLTNWWDARQVTLTAGAVSTWPDLIGGGVIGSYPLLGQTANPTYNASDATFNGLPSIQTDGSSMWLEGNSSITWTTTGGAHSFTMFAVWYYPSTATLHGIVGSSDGNVSTLEVGRGTANHIDATMGTTMSFGTATNGIVVATATTFAVGTNACALYVNSSTVGVITSTQSSVATGKLYVFSQNGSGFPPAGTKFLALGLNYATGGSGASVAQVSNWLTYYAALTGNSWSLEEVQTDWRFALVDIVGAERARNDNAWAPLQMTGTD